MATIGENQWAPPRMKIIVSLAKFIFVWAMIGIAKISSRLEGSHLEMVAKRCYMTSLVWASGKKTSLCRVQNYVTLGRSTL